MGVRELLGRNPVELAAELASAGNTKENTRRQRARQRVDLYYDKSGDVLHERMAPLFHASSHEKRQRQMRFASFASAMSIFRRVVNEVATPVYNPPPLRVVMDSSGADADKEANAAYFSLCTSGRLNQRMDLACRLLHACNDVILHPKFSRSLNRLVVDVLTPATCSVVKHPDDPSVPIAVVYLDGNGEWCYWDDAEAFKVNKNGAVTYVMPTGEHPGVLPFLEIHARERLGHFWDEDTGEDLVNAQMTVGFLLAQAVRLHHTQGHTMIAVSGGDPSEFPNGQILDPENPIFSGQGNNISAIHNPADASSLLRTAETVAMSAAANYGLSRERMNAAVTQPTDQAAMYERRYEAVQVMADAEVRLFDLVRKIMGSELAVPADAVLSVDFPDISAKGDRKSQLDVREQERHMGIRSVLDDALEDNPELGTDRDAARAHVDKRLAEEAWYVERRRALGISGDFGPATPGQTQQANGAMGPAVRDGLMTKDDASKQSETGPPRT